MVNIDNLINEFIDTIHITGRLGNSLRELVKHSLFILVKKKDGDLTIPQSEIYKHLLEDFYNLTCLTTDEKDELNDVAYDISESFSRFCLQYRP